MNTVLAFTLKDVGFFFLWILLIVILVYLIMILRKAYQSLKMVKALIEENREEIDATLDNVPDLTKNAKDISTEVAYTLGRFRGTIDNVADTSEEVTKEINDNKDIVGTISSFFHTASVGKKAYDKFFNKADGSEEPKTDKDKPTEDN